MCGNIKVWETELWEQKVDRNNHISSSTYILVKRQYIS